MPFLRVDAAVVFEIGPLIDDTDFKSLEMAIAYNAAGMSVDLIVNSGSAITKTDITPTTAGTNDWTHKGNGVYELEITAAQNIQEGTARIVGVCDGVLPFESPVYNIVKTNVYDSLILGTDKLQVDAVEISSDAVAANDLELLVENSKGSDNKVLLSADAQTGVTIPTVTTTGTASTVTNGAKSAELAKVPKSDSNVVWNATAQTTIQTKAAAALTAYNPPTDTEMLAAHSTTDGLIAALNDISAAQVNAEVDAALNTAVPGAPTAHSINERVKSMDDLTQASGGGDLAAVKAKTDNIPASPATEAKQNTLITDVDNNETKIDDVKTQIGTAGAGLTNVGMFSQANTELSAIPTTTSSLKTMLQFLFEFWRNKKETKDDSQKLYKEDSSTSLGTRTLADDTVTLTEGKMS